MDITINKLRVFFEIQHRIPFFQKRISQLLTKNPLKAERALDEVTCCIKPGRVTAIIGRSGSGKSVLAKAIARIIQGRPGIISGQILYGKTTLIEAAQALGSYDFHSNKWAERIPNSHRTTLCNGLIQDTHQYPQFLLRSPKIGMIFQDPSEYINPFFSYLELIQQAIDNNLSIDEKKHIITTYLKQAQLPDDLIDEILSQNPIKLSGGQKQRFSFAMALAVEPAFIIADEPITDLDVINAFFIKELIKHEKEKGKTIILISHDLDMVNQLADNIIVIHQGRIIEMIDNHTKQDNVAYHLKQLRHPYTVSLIQSFLKLYDRKHRKKWMKKKLQYFEKKNACRYEKCQLWSKNFFECQHIEQGEVNYNCYCALNSEKVRSEIEKNKSEILLLYNKYLKLKHKTVDDKNEKNKLLFECYQVIKNRQQISDDWLRYSEFIHGNKSNTWKKQREKQLILDIKDLTVSYNNNFPVISDVCIEFFKFHQSSNTHIGIIGESGAGKTTLALTIMKAISKNVHADYIKVRLPTNSGSNLIDLNSNSYSEKLFSKHVQYIFQDCGQALHPKKTLSTILNQTAAISGQSTDYYERIWNRLGLNKRDLEKCAIELSGGMKRRAYIVRALTALSPKTTFPKIVITDEAVKGIDTVAQEEILTFLSEEAQKSNIHYINISHNLSLVRALSDVIYVMLKGRVVEICQSIDFFEENNYLPSFFHPYSRSLKYCAKEMNTIEEKDKPLQVNTKKRDLFAQNQKQGCPFYPNCPLESANDLCLKMFPPFIWIKDQDNDIPRYHFVACHHIPIDCKYSK